MRKKGALRTLAISFVFIIFGVLLWRSPAAQHEIARIMNALNPNRSNQMYEKLKNYPIERLLKLLESGDFTKQGQAYKRLFQRKDEVSFTEVEQLMRRTKDLDARQYSQRLLLAIDEVRGSEVLIGELNKPDLNMGERRRILSLLAKIQYEPVFPHLRDFALNDSGNKHASSELLKNFGDTRGIPILRNRLATDTHLDKFERERVEKAIQALETA